MRSSVLKIITLLCLAMFIGQCGTIAGRKQLQTFDSEPRGASIFVPKMEKKNPLLGVTPFVIETSRRDSQKFEYTLGRKKTEAFENDCRFRWGTSGLGNLLIGFLFAANPIVGVVAFSGALTSDFMTGAAYHCPDVTIKPERPVKGKTFCKKIIVAPPKFIDEKLSDLVARKWIARNTSSKSCNSFISYEQTKKVFNYLNTNNTNTISPSSLTLNYRNRLALETKASHLIVFRVEEDEKNWIISSAEIDLFKDVETTPSDEGFKFSKAKTYIEKGKYAERSLFERVSDGASSRLLSWLPNSFTFSAGINELDIQYPEDEEGTTVKQLVRLSRFISGWGIAYIDHPSAYSNWETSLKLSPSIDFIWTKYEVKSTLVDADSPFAKFELDLISLIATYDLSWTVFTPFGGTSLIGGIGGAIRYTDLPEQKSQYNGILVSRLGIRHIAFFSQNIFMKIEVSRVAFASPIIDTEVLKSSSNIAVTFGIGYFFPGWRYSLANQFSSQ